MALIEHAAWEGPNYKKGGINGQQIAIVGHSHHGDDDSNDLYFENRTRRYRRAGEL
jgi:hypothetical protein